ncbi:MAG TPA: HPr family phosphocarrier protein [Candidatus Bathyarchaeia archaeon]|uniref:HPr family phosphocarrier protein n=1 Tax=Brevibacillus migulae TaxID=1644114 RepID=UPI00106EA739|nr:HPr family phosphocarrier protein [Brevibacillus migulae]HZG17095.1 HPr family phosphocarrier protein [Candidatus Bathyarchaeia archaeon]
MVSKQVTIAHEHGLHARPATLFVNTAKQFASSIEIVKGEKKADGKSILGVMALAVKHNETVELVTNGPDEQEALDKLAELLATP